MAKSKPKVLKKTISINHPGDLSPLEITLKVNFEPEPAPVEFKSVNFIQQISADSECPDNKFTYSIVTDNATILFFSLEGYQKNNPGNSGEFTACIDDATDLPKVHIVAMGRIDNPGGTATLQVTFKQKPLFSSPKAFKLMSNGILMINALVQLP